MRPPGQIGTLIDVQASLNDILYQSGWVKRFPREPHKLQTASSTLVIRNCVTNVTDLDDLRELQ